MRTDNINLHLDRAAVHVCFILSALLAGCAEKVITPDPSTIEQQRDWLKGTPGDWRNNTPQARGEPAPPAVKPVPEDARIIDLAEPDLRRMGLTPLAETLAYRRSRRVYSDTALSLEDLGFLLWSAQGINGADRDDNGVITHLYRTAPSAGGRYPLETYLAVQRVESLAPGLYRYRSAEHQLIALKDGDVTTGLQAACYGSEAVANAAVVVIWTAVPARTEWKYGQLSHRMIAMEAGHACQNLYLAAESMDTGACAMLAYDQSSLDHLLGVDGQDEFALYMATVGKWAGK